MCLCAIKPARRPLSQPESDEEAQQPIAALADRTSPPADLFVTQENFRRAE
jgi:hypothetical protein